jgi:hypothetical protein
MYIPNKILVNIKLIYFLIRHYTVKKHKYIKIKFLIIEDHIRRYFH